MACGYDAQGNWRTLPLQVSYTWNGFSYDVTVLNAWNPWTQSWNIGVDMPAYSTTVGWQRIPWHSDGFCLLSWPAGLHFPEW